MMTPEQFKMIFTLTTITNKDSGLSKQEAIRKAEKTTEKYSALRGQEEAQFVHKYALEVIEEVYADE